MGDLLSVQVYVWEIDAYDDNGVYGGPPSPKPNPASLREMLGVNGIWGWGWGKSSTTLSAGQGAALYAPVASYGRNYHNMNWDVHDPDDKPDYARMSQVCHRAVPLVPHFRLARFALLRIPACSKSNNTNARLTAFTLSLTLDPMFGIHSHKTSGNAQLLHLL